MKNVQKIKEKKGVSLEYKFGFLGLTLSICLETPFGGV